MAFWFRSSNKRARYLPDFEYSGRLELLVWSIPIMTVLLVGGVAWIGSYDLDPPKPIASSEKPVRVQVVSLDWKWLFIYPDEGIASVNHLTVPSGTPISFELTSSGVMNSFFVPQLGGQIYTMAGMVTRLHLLADQTGTYRGMSANYSGAGFSDMRLPRRCGSARAICAVGGGNAQHGPCARCAKLCGAGQAEPGGHALQLSRRRSRSVQGHRQLRIDIGTCLALCPAGFTEGREMNFLGKLTWDAVPYHEPIIMGAAGVVGLIIALILGWVICEGLRALSVARVDHLRRP